MVKKFSFLLVICLLTLGLERTSYAEYSFRVILKYPFSSLHYDTLGNIVSDSLVRARPIKPIIFRSVAESLYQESVTNDSGYAVFVFDKWQDNTPVLPNNISRMAIDFPCTDKVIEVNGQITFEHLKYSDIDFRRSPGEIEIILPLTVYKDSFAIGSSSWINVCNIAIMNDMHIGDGYNDFGTYGWNDADSGHAPSNEYIINNHNVVVHINQHNPDFVVVLGDVTQSAERSEFQRARSMLGNLNTKPYIPILRNHDAWPYVWTNEASIPSDCFIGEYFYDGFETMFDSVAAIFPNWRKDPYFSSSPNLWSYYLNLSFDFQNWKFVGADFNSRNDAPWPWFGILGEADVNNHTLQWITQNVNVATNERRKLFVLGHHPLIERLGWWGCFTAHEIHQISDAGLKNNQPSARWVGGHVHGASHQRIDTTYYGDDTVAIVFTLNGACENGVYGWVSIYDKLYARIWHTPFDPIYGGVPALADFQTTYSYIGSENAYSSSYWEFGDGTVSYLQNPSHLYHLYDSFMKNFKVTLTVTAANGRKVSTCKQIRVVAMPYDLRTTYPGFLKEDSVKLVWNFDCPQCVTGYLIYRGGCLYAEVNDPNQKYYIDANVQRGITYGYRVHAKRYGSGMPHTPPATLNVQVPWVDAPTVRQPVEIPPNQVRISWHNNSNYTINYTIARWDTIHGWQNSYKPNWNDTLLTDTVSFLYKYRYKVKAKDAQSHYTDWSNVVEFSCGVLAQSNYSKMSAYNNGAKVFKIWNNVQKSTFFRQAENVDFCWDSPPTFVLYAKTMPEIFWQISLYPLTNAFFFLV